MTMEFLQSPIINIPIFEFVDENCIYFDEEEEH